MSQFTQRESKETGFGEAPASLALLACSACAGDYEDPDRTAWTPAADNEDDFEGDREPTNTMGADEFPLEE